eukprot:scaffold55147_cov57-Phaeocystis_antarctica.AAC.2
MREPHHEGATGRADAENVTNDLNLHALVGHGDGSLPARLGLLGLHRRRESRARFLAVGEVRPGDDHRHGFGPGFGVQKLGHLPKVIERELGERVAELGERHATSFLRRRIDELPVLGVLVLGDGESPSQYPVLLLGDHLQQLLGAGPLDCTYMQEGVRARRRARQWAGRGAAGHRVAMRMAPCVGTAESGRGRAGSGGSALHSSSSFLTTGPMPPRTTVRSPTNISMDSSSSICWV